MYPMGSPSYRVWDPREGWTPRGQTGKTSHKQERGSRHIPFRSHLGHRHQRPNPTLLPPTERHCWNLCYNSRPSIVSGIYRCSSWTDCDKTFDSFIYCRLTVRLSRRYFVLLYEGIFIAKICILFFVYHRSFIFLSTGWTLEWDKRNGRERKVENKFTYVVECIKTSSICCKTQDIIHCWLKVRRNSRRIDRNSHTVGSLIHTI